jgi:hypothetical protein
MSSCTVPAVHNSVKHGESKEIWLTGNAMLGRMLLLSDACGVDECRQHPL